MPMYNVTIPDVSPLITYNNWWGDSSHADGAWPQYVDGTFHATDAYGASASLKFNGTGIYIYGAKRDNHDDYWVTLDGQTTTANGHSDQALFNQTLFSAANLDPSKEHEVNIQNLYRTTDPSWLDVDYMVVTAGDKNATSQSTEEVWDDNYPNITYSDGWETSPNGFEQFYYNQSMHRAHIQNARASIIFTGNEISVYGCTSSNHGLFSVSLDGSVPQFLNGSAPEARYQLLLYYASGLRTGQHNLTFTNVDPNDNWFDLDKVVLTSWPQSRTSASDTSSPTGHKSSVGGIVGGIIAAVLGIGLIIAGVFFLLRRRGRRGIDRIRHGMIKEDILPDPEVPPITPFVAASHSSSHGYHERDPLSPSNASSSDIHTLNSLGKPLYGRPASYHPSLTLPYNASTVGSETQFHSSDSKHGLPYDSAQNIPLGENPHKDFPPPDYFEATSSHH